LKNQAKGKGVERLNVNKKNYPLGQKNLMFSKQSSMDGIYLWQNNRQEIIKANKINTGTRTPPGAGDDGTTILVTVGP
jgi:hypothetical protein